jgi:hypothetical protein
VRNADHHIEQLVEVAVLLELRPHHPVDVEVGSREIEDQT